jgi:hypothetical protein
MPLLPCGWESAPLPTRQWCRKEYDGLSGHEAAEISSQRSSDAGGSGVGGATVALTERHAVSMHTCAPDSLRVDDEDGHPRGWPLLCDQASPSDLCVKATPRVSRRLDGVPPRHWRAAPSGQGGAPRAGSRGQVCRSIPPCPSPEIAAPTYRQNDG